MGKEFQVLVIYDIADNKQRAIFSKTSSSYGIRIQKSAFEMMMTKEKLDGLLNAIPRLIKVQTDNVRVYELRGNYQIYQFGVVKVPVLESVLIL